MKGYKYKIKVSERIAETFGRTLGVCCDLYNAGLQDWLVSISVSSNNAPTFTIRFLAG